MKTILYSIIFLCMFSTLAYSDERQKVVIYKDPIHEHTWIATNGHVDLYYKEKICPYEFISQAVLHNIIDDSNAGVFDWNKMDNTEYAKKTSLKMSVIV